MLQKQYNTQNISIEQIIFYFLEKTYIYA